MDIAVVGASNNPEKYGYRVVRHLLAEGHRVFPVNLREKIILGQPTFASLADIDHAIDIVDIVVPPATTLKILEQARELGLRDVWIQPGAEDDAVVDYLNRYRTDFGRVIYNSCIMTSLDRFYP